MYPESDFYRVVEKGLCLVFINEKFKDEKYNLDLSKDVNHLTTIFEKLNFDVQVEKDKKKGDIKQLLKAVARQEPFKYSCLAIVVSSHGTKKKLLAYDCMYTKSKLWKYFIGKFDGIPKLFFVDSCQGTKTDVVHTVDVDHSLEQRSLLYTANIWQIIKDFSSKWKRRLLRQEPLVDDPNPTTPNLLPFMVDSIFIQSSYDGYVSYCDDGESWMVKALYDVLFFKPNPYELLHFLTDMNVEVALRFKEENKTTVNKAMPQFTSRLTKLFKFDLEEYDKNLTRQESGCYDIKTGLCVIFNHQKFRLLLPELKNATKVVETLTSCFETLNFDVRSYKDNNCSEIVETLKSIPDLVTSNKYNCLVIIVYTHSVDGKLAAFDKLYQKSEVWEKFFQKLIGIPKLFFIDTDSMDLQVKTKCMNSLKKDTLPSMSDILYMHSRFNETVTWENEIEDGSFIKALCEELESKALTEELVHMLTMVNRNVNSSYAHIMPEFTSMLTKPLRFNVMDVNK